jgi:hypothetical protein
MASKSKMRGDSSNAMFTLLARVVECSKEGEPELMNSLGLSCELVHELEKLGPDQLLTITARYFRDKDPLSIYNIDMGFLCLLTTDELKRGGHRDRRMDEYISHHASKQMLERFFGTRGTNISTRKSVLKTPKLPNRSKACTQEESRKIFDSWQATRFCDDIIDRYLLTAKLCQLPLFKIEAFVQTIEKVESARTLKTVSNSTTMKERASA